MGMEKVRQELLTKLQANPGTEFRLIVRVRGDLDARAEAVAKKGLKVQRKLKLIAALAVSGLGTKVQTLVKEDWVVSVEEDKTVRIS